jgi:NAD(P)-dependent dehydrogenase (short-subunit alcohol dehydrogenase family)
MTGRSATLEGKAALVTGAARRIGSAIATTLHAAGSRVAVHYRNSAADAQNLVARLNDIRAGSAMAVEADLLDTVLPASGHGDGRSQRHESCIESSGAISVSNGSFDRNQR